MYEAGGIYFTPAGVETADSEFSRRLKTIKHTECDEHEWSWLGTYLNVM